MNRSNQTELSIEEALGYLSDITESDEMIITDDNCDTEVLENKGQTDKKLMVDLINDFNDIKIDGTKYVLHHISGEAADPKDRITSNMLLIPDSDIVSGNAIHLRLHKLARDYAAFKRSCEALQKTKWLYIGSGHKLTEISVEEIVERLVPRYTDDDNK